MYLKERLMYSFPFPIIEKLELIDFSKPVIWVLNATRTPPHIGISVNKKYFSLKANGKDESIDIQLFLDLIDRKSIPTLFIQLERNIEENDVLHSYQQFHKAGENNSTCLSPIAQINGVPTARQLSELLHSIKDTIKHISGLNLPADYKALPSYSIETIHQHIEDLKIYVGE